MSTRQARWSTWGTATNVAHQTGVSFGFNGSVMSPGYTLVRSILNVSAWCGQNYAESVQPTRGWYFQASMQGLTGTEPIRQLHFTTKPFRIDTSTYHDSVNGKTWWWRELTVGDDNNAFWDLELRLGGDATHNSQAFLSLASHPLGTDDLTNHQVYYSILWRALVLDPA